MDEKAKPQFSLDDHPRWLGETVPNTVTILPSGEATVQIYPSLAREQVLKGERVQVQGLPDGRLKFFKLNLKGKRIPLGISTIMTVEEPLIPLVRHWTEIE
jgi:hypothetical protein